MERYGCGRTEPAIVNSVMFALKAMAVDRVNRHDLWLPRFAPMVHVDWNSCFRVQCSPSLTMSCQTGHQSEYG